MKKGKVKNAGWSRKDIWGNAAHDEKAEKKFVWEEYGSVQGSAWALLFGNDGLYGSGRG